jgi:hypothetical protein
MGGGRSRELGGSVGVGYESTDETSATVTLDAGNTKLERRRSEELRVTTNLVFSLCKEDQPKFGQNRGLHTILDPRPIHTP